jgi:ATP phosphoribosyltransferase regulatory subunit
MALKPDVTLSIVKNTRESDGIRKVYYNENVYRVPRGAISFKEIMQAGLECIGELDKYSILEVLRLAQMSLESISSDYVLDVSDVGIVSSLIEEMGVSAAAVSDILQCVGEKNVHGIDVICASAGKDVSVAETLKRLISMSGDGDEMLDILSGSKCIGQARELYEIISVLRQGLDGKIRIDFSVVDDTNYYSGIVFKGFIKGIPTSVLSGGRYDNLMKKLGKNSGAVGFAVYLDFIDELDDVKDEYDTDVFVLYDSDCSLSALNKLVDSIRAGGETVTVSNSLPDRLKYKRLIKFGRDGAEVDNGLA